MILEFTDTDYGVIMDALLITSEKIQAEGRETPNLDVATVLREANAAAMRARAAREATR
jgi:hypothetical protein